VREEKNSPKKKNPEFQDLIFRHRMRRKRKKERRERTSRSPSTKEEKRE